MLFAALRFVGRLAVVLRLVSVPYCWLSGSKSSFLTPCWWPGRHEDVGGGDSIGASYGNASCRGCPSFTRIDIAAELEDLINGYAATYTATIHHLDIWRAEPELIQSTISSGYQEPQLAAPLWESELKDGDLFRDILLLVQGGICSPLQYQLRRAEQLLAGTRPGSVEHLEFARRWVDDSCKSISFHQHSWTGRRYQHDLASLGRGPLFEILRRLGKAQFSLVARNSRGDFRTDGDLTADDTAGAAAASRPERVLSDVLLQCLFEPRKLFPWQTDIEPELRGDLDPLYRHVLRRSVVAWEEILGVLNDQLLPAVSLYLAVEVQKEEDLAEQRSSLLASASWIAALGGGRLASWWAHAQSCRHVNEMARIITSTRRQMSYLQAIINDAKSWDKWVASLEERRAAASARLDANRNGRMWPLPRNKAPINATRGLGSPGKHRCSDECQLLATYQFPAPGDLWNFLKRASEKLEAHVKEIGLQRDMSSVRQRMRKGVYERAGTAQSHAC